MANTNFDGITLPAAGTLVVGGTTISETDLQALDGVTATPAEINVLAGVTPGTVTAGKAVVTTTNKHIDALVISDGGLALGSGAGTAVTATAAELNLADGSVAGTAVASKLACLGANKELDEFHTAALYLGAAAGTQVTATAAELNKLAGVTGGTAAASKAVVLDANKRVAGIQVQHAVADATADGAITIAPGVVKITKAGAAALTIADPGAGDEGIVMIITAATAAAHTVSNAAGSGFNAGGAGSDVGTYGGAVGDCLMIVAVAQKWHVIVSKNVTLG